MSERNMQRPEGLKDLASSYQRPQGRVEIRPATWARYWPSGPAYTGLLETAGTAKGDLRLIGREDLLAATTAMNLDDQLQVLQTFVLVMAWGNGNSGRGLYNTRAAIADPARAHARLASTASALRAITDVADGSLEKVYRDWDLPRVGRSFFTKWFAFAGRTDRDWQPLILDDRVFRTLNKTLGRSTIDLAGSHRRARRYRAYVEALHQWSDELGDEADRLEWVLFEHNGGLGH